MKDLAEANLSNSQSSFKYTYKKPNKQPLNKKEFFEAAFSRNKPDLDEPLINIDKNLEEGEIDEKKSQVIEKVIS